MDNAFELSDLGLSGTQGRIVAGFFEDSTVPSSIMVVDGQLYSSPAPYVFTSASPVDPSLTGVVDLAVLAGQASSGGDLLVVSTATGLEALEYDAASQAYVRTALAGSAAWAGATQLKPRLLASTTGVLESLCGLDPVNGVVLAGDVAGGSMQPRFSLNIPIAVHTFDVLDFDRGVLTGGAMESEIAVTCSLGLFVYTNDGNSFLHREFTNAVDSGCVTFESHEQVGKFERLAYWFIDGSDDNKVKFTVLDDSGPQTYRHLSLSIPGPWPEDQPVPFYMSSADHNVDRQDDLLLQLNRQYAVVLINQAELGSPPPTDHFAQGGGLKYKILPLKSSFPTASVAPSEAYAFFGDIDGDPGADLMVPIDTGSEVFVITNKGSITVDGVDRLVGQSAEDFVHSDMNYNLDATVQGSRINLALELIQDIEDRGFTHLHVNVFHQSDPTGPGSEPPPHHDGPLNRYHPLLPVATSSFQWIDLPLPPDQNSSGITQNPTDKTWIHADHVWVVFRFVSISDIDEPAPAPDFGSRYYVGGMTLQHVPGDNNHDLVASGVYLRNRIGAGADNLMDICTAPNACASSSNNGGAYFGLYVPQRNLPSFVTTPTYVAPNWGGSLIPWQPDQ